MIGWAGNAMIIWSWYAMGNGSKAAPLWGAAGSLAWAVEAFTAKWFALCFIELLLAALGLRLFLKNREET